jgi:hypothetical protein
VLLFPPVLKGPTVLRVMIDGQPTVGLSLSRQEAQRVTQEIHALFGEP